MNEAFFLAAGTTLAAALIGMAYSAPRVFLSIGKLLWLLVAGATGGVTGMYLSTLQYAPKFAFLILEQPSPCISDDCHLLWMSLTRGKETTDANMNEVSMAFVIVVAFATFLLICTLIAIRARRAEPATVQTPASNCEAPGSKSDAEKRHSNKLIAAMRRRDRRAARLIKQATTARASNQPAPTEK